MNPFEELESMTVDRIGSDIVIHCPTEESAEAGRQAFATVLPLMGMIAAWVENGGPDGLFGQL